MSRTRLRSQTVVRELIGCALSEPSCVAGMSAADLDLLLRCMRRVRLHGRLAIDLQGAGCFDALPQVARDQLASALVFAEARKRLALWELDRIAWAMRDKATIDLICLKGCAYILRDVPNVRGRIFADVDVMVARNCLGVVEQTLNARGWETKELTPYDENYYRRWSHELPPLMHVEREVEIDLHHNIAAPTARLRPPASALIDKSVAIEGSRFHVLADEDIVLHAIVHLMFASDPTDKLRDLVDIKDLLGYFEGRDRNFWQRLLARADKLQLTRPTYYGVHYARRLLNCNVPVEVVEQIEDWAPIRPVRWLMDRIVPRALFPQHPEHRSRLSEFCRILLYMRSHWLRMPPWLLLYHLSYKFVAVRLRRHRRASGDS